MSEMALSEKHCVPCEGGISPLTREESERYLKKLAPEWTLTADAKEIRKDFKFKGFQGTLGFVNAVAWIANQEGHHPDLEVGFNHCLIRYSTHAIGGLSENDFICAAKIDKLITKK
ncbi:MAG TPA: 4a-hydroxytetrahydrobiopterin dehydratase [Gammaproteobacteria bacterium]